MISIVLGLVMANFFHAFLMNGQTASAEIYGACHAHETADQPDGQTAKPLPCCADSDKNSAAPLLAKTELVKLYHALPFFSGPAVTAQTGTRAPELLTDPPDQIALDKIVLRI